MARLPNVRLRQMRIFLEIVRQGSLVKASQALNITQSAISKSLKELESELGTKLLQRDSRGIKLTQVGESFYQNTTQVVVSYSRALTSATNQVVEREPLRIGTLPTAAGSIVPRAILVMMERGLDPSFYVESGLYELLADKVRKGELDFIVGRLINRDLSGMSFEALYEEDILTVVAENHPLTRENTVTCEQLLDFPIVTPPAIGSSVREAVDDYFFACGVTPPKSAVVSAQSDGFARTFTVLSDAIWFVPKGVVETDLHLGNIVRLPIEHSMLKAMIGLTIPTNVTLTAPGEIFVQVLRELSVSNAAGN